MPDIRTLIVDDEAIIRRGLRAALDRIGGVEVVGECSGGGEAIARILAEEMELVLLDVQMPDCSGLEVVQQVGPERMPAVVFVTAHDEYAVKAFELHAVDYVLKPFDPERLKDSIDRVRARLASRQPTGLAEALESLLRSTAPSTASRLVVRSNEKYEFVDVNSIDWAESANNYVQLHCGASTHVMGETLSRLERKLAPRGFVRVHRCYLVNTARIIAIHSMIHGTYIIELRNGIRLRTGRQYKDVIRTLVTS